MALFAPPKTPYRNNRDPTRTFTLNLAGARSRGRVRVWRYSPVQYQWIDAGPQSHAGRNLPPETTLQPAAAAIVAPPASLTVVVAPLPRTPRKRGMPGHAHRLA